MRFHYEAVGCAVYIVSEDEMYRRSICVTIDEDWADTIAAALNQEAHELV